MRPRQTLREMVVHPEASVELRKRSGAADTDGSTGAHSSVASFASASLRHMKDRIAEIGSGGLNSASAAKFAAEATEKSLQLSLKVYAHREYLRTFPPNAALSFSGHAAALGTPAARQPEAQLIHDHWCFAGCSAWQPSSGGMCNPGRSAKVRVIPPAEVDLRRQP